MAVTATTVWEVQTVGAVANGGGFDPAVALPGTDWSQSGTAHQTYTDLVINASDTTKCTSAAHPFAASDVGNVINITSGTGWTVQRAVIIAVSGVIAQCNASLGTLSSTGGNGTLGGAINTLAGPPAIPGNVVWVKAGITYLITATQTYATSGTAGNPITYIGYYTTRGDGGRVTVLRSSGATINVFSVTGNFRTWVNFTADCGAGGTTTISFNVTGAQNIFINCKAVGFSQYGWQMASGATRSVLVNCWATAGTGASATPAAFNFGNASLQRLIGCIASGNACAGFKNTSSSVGGIILEHCISANNTSHGYWNTNACGMHLMNCIAYGNTGSGFLIDTTATATAADECSAFNSIFVNQSVGWGIYSNGFDYGAVGKYPLLFDYNFFFNNAAGARSNIPAGDHDVPLSGDPFTNGTLLDFSLLATGAGLQVRDGGWPGTLQAGGTGFLDGGALQHSDSSVTGADVFTRLAGGGLVVPRPILPGGLQSALLIDATGEKVAFIGRVWFAERTGTKKISRVGFRFGAVTKAGGSALTVSLQDVSTTTSPAQPDGTPDQTVAIANAASTFLSNTWHRTNTLSATRTVTYGDLLAVVFEYDGAGCLGSDSVVVSSVGSIAITEPACMLFNGATWAIASGAVAPDLVLEFDDGTYGTLHGSLPMATYATVNYNVNTVTQDEYALLFSFPYAVKIDAVWAVTAGSANGDFEILVYDGTTALRTISVDASTLATFGTSRFVEWPIDELILAANKQYRVGQRPITTNNVSLTIFDVADAAHFAVYDGGPSFVLDSRFNQGAWIGAQPVRRPYMGVRISAIDITAVGGGGGGGGAVLSRIMTGY